MLGLSSLVWAAPARMGAVANPPARREPTPDLGANGEAWRPAQTDFGMPSKASQQDVAHIFPYPMTLDYYPATVRDRAQRQFGPEPSQGQRERVLTNQILAAGRGAAARPVRHRRQEDGLAGGRAVRREFVQRRLQADRVRQAGRALWRHVRAGAQVGLCAAQRAARRRHVDAQPLPRGGRDGRHGAPADARHAARPPVGAAARAAAGRLREVGRRRLPHGAARDPAAAAAVPLPAAPPRRGPAYAVPPERANEYGPASPAAYPEPPPTCVPAKDVPFLRSLPAAALGEYCVPLKYLPYYHPASYRMGDHPRTPEGTARAARRPPTARSSSRRRRRRRSSRRRCPSRRRPSLCRTASWAWAARRPAPCRRRPPTTRSAAWRTSRRRCRRRRCRRR